MKLNKTKQTIIGFVLAGLLAAPAIVQAQPSAHYAPGLEGLNAATLPPPGVYLRDYNYFYYSDQYNDASGNKVGAANAKAFIYAQVPRLLWITDLQLLGGNIGLDALVPFQYISLRAGSFDDHTFGVGDPFIEATWSKHIQQFDFALGFGVWMPTENYTPSNPTWAGLGYWGYMFTAGATWYIDKDKKWSLSALNRYEINSQQDDTGITPGQVYTVEGGVGYAISKTVSLGGITYYQQQVNSDTGSQASKERDRVAGVGPEISAFFPSATLGLSLRYAYEFMAESRLQGHTITLTLTKRF
jgi:hypothetical protein